MGKFSTALRISISIVFLGALILSANAQQITGTLRGTIVDPNGAAVSAANVTVTQVETGLVRSAAPDRQGSYVFLELPVGHYQLQVQAKSFEKYLQQGISLNVNQVATVNVHLRVGSDTQEVEVKADAELVQDTI